MFISTLPQLLGVVERSMLVNTPPKLDSQEAIEQYVRTFFYGKLVEEVYLFSLNSSYRLLAVSKLSEGVQNETPLYLSLAVKRAILDNASVVIIAHNHPCGILSASIEDVKLTARLSMAFQTVDIVMQDSLVVAGGQCYSIASNYNLEKVAKEISEGRM